MGKLRIIAGRWKRRTLRFPEGAGVRPTPDRVRETLFNWLAPRLPGARCLDLFAGSGALGFEAASRGASEVVLVEQSARLARWLRETASALGAEAVRVVQADALAWLQGFPAERYDIVFIDPPFARGELLEGACRRLHEGGWLAPGALVYLECAAPESALALPEGWRVPRSGKAGGVRYYLAAPSACG
ncbi:MAG: 16S rRNA (guanine(966)-N(2))-methyltransferase RsmD [Gammaproteobacteria bacterium]|nr:16S rRNA (guanine(966)-N(2))-methyltransferase RsmD [Gammaproteobacteria bacterium]NIR82214.1 16S rRNA (guanine(966)-N(2))-methyltransferase RsmD [Gammaproteobacteria bacterium]NIR90813.1 16S rRNA (guanine(966)-N(2))-methyltransferase RsmD [Gammaproteobacteria bacterium]NIU03364.1 16S rRNA (guanine(966)-N(2))-methyltransferase RsmD [Gammaproteobacteria bacterium]NIV50860.1 16S rRNA (guanine(966)-N(2))-methyltransferase RsmD [Gammaproteobacteria bacterium]